MDRFDRMLLDWFNYYDRDKIVFAENLNFSIRYDKNFICQPIVYFDSFIFKSFCKEFGETDALTIMNAQLISREYIYDR